MPEYLVDDLWLCDDRDDLHVDMAMGAEERVNLEDLPDEPGPTGS